MAVQTTFVDPASTVPTDPAPVNTGNGTISTPIVASSTLTETFTITCTVPGGSGTAQFSVVGSVSGNIGTATSNAEFVDANQKVRFTITAGGTPFIVNDDFDFNTTAGTPMNKANFDSHALPLADKNAANAFIEGQLMASRKMDAFPSGTVMVFFQAAAPTGWTQVVTQNDKALRVVSGAGGGAAGTTAFSGLGAAGGNASVDHTHTGPSHTHAITTGSFTSYIAGGPEISVPTSPANTNAAGTGATGGQSATHNHTGLQPQYVDVIICSKD